VQKSGAEISAYSRAWGEIPAVQGVGFAVRKRNYRYTCPQKDQLRNPANIAAFCFPFGALVLNSPRLSTGFRGATQRALLAQPLVTEQRPEGRNKSGRTRLFKYLGSPRAPRKNVAGCDIIGSQHLPRPGYNGRLICGRATTKTPM
jgi:hypothetical protein